MRKTFLLDTSVLIDDPCAYKHFNNSDVIIPIAVLNELDNLKKLPGSAGKNARVSIKLLDDISNQGDISTGVDLDNDIMLKVDATYYDTKSPLFAGFGDPTYGDTQILACTLVNYLEHPNKDVTLVSNDINLRIKAKSRAINAISHHSGNFNASDLYLGSRVVVNPEAGIELQQKNVLDPRLFGLADMNLHECVLFEDEFGNGIAMGRKVGAEKIKLIKRVFPWGISARNKEQTFAIDLIMDKGVDLVTLIGKAGTGKSLIALAAAVDLVLNQKKFDKLIIYRPVQAVGNDIGFLPGTMEEKLAPWFQAIMDNFEFLFNAKGAQHGDWRKNLEMFQRKGQLEMEAITYIRGRSIPNSVILVDECQNLTKEDVKTILTRAGEGTKIILTGDIEQIDNTGLDATNNGLTYIIEKFKDSDLAGHITFVQGERSRLASKAAEIL
jgi:PhoH-like ATPase